MHTCMSIRWSTIVWTLQYTGLVVGVVQQQLDVSISSVCCPMVGSRKAQAYWTSLGVKSAKANDCSLVEEELGPIGYGA